MNEIINCDMCGSEIKDNKCNCGTWESAEEMSDCPLKKALEYYHERKSISLTAYAPHLGCAVVFFRGDYKDCEKVQQFIYELKNRPHYNQ